MTPTRPTTPSVLLVGASRGLGLAMAAAFLGHGWHVVGTVRDAARTGLHDLADAHPGRVTVERLDVTRPDHLAALNGRLSPGSLQMLFVNAGTATDAQADTVAAVSDEEFVRVMLTNALGVVRTVEALQGAVQADGLIGVMSSGQGSIANNQKGGHEVYRASKAALNQLLRSVAARQAGGSRAMVLMAPGWIRTDLGGPEAPFGIDETIPQVVETLLAQQGKPGLRFLDRFGKEVPW